MGPILASLLKLQAVEHDLAHVRRRLRSKQNVVNAIQRKVDELRTRREELTSQARNQQKDTDKHELTRASREEEIAQLRGALNRTRTNKEYSAILTQINTYKADNSKLEETILKAMEGVDTVKAEMEKVDAQTDAEQKRLDQANATNAQEIAKLEGMMAELQAKRDEAAKGIPADVMRAFDRLAGAKDGEAMAAIEVVDAKREEFTCGGCYMSLSAEHFSALLSRDEIRTCDSCGRILYVEAKELV
jgi:uncharacterized protein